MLMGGFKNPRHSFHEKLVRLRRRRRLDLRDRETVRKRGGHFHDIIDFAHALAVINTHSHTHRARCLEVGEKREQNEYPAMKVGRI